MRGEQMAQAQDRGYAVVVIGAGFPDDIFNGVRDACTDSNLRVVVAGARTATQSYWDNEIAVDTLLEDDVDKTAATFGSDLRLVIVIRGTGNRSIRVQQYVDSALRKGVYVALPGRAACYIPEQFEGKVADHPLARERALATFPWSGVIDPEKKIITYKFPPPEDFEGGYRAGRRVIELLFYYRDSRGRKFTELPLEIAKALDSIESGTLKKEKKRGRPKKGSNLEGAV